MALTSIKVVDLKALMTCLKILTLVLEVDKEMVLSFHLEVALMISLVMMMRMKRRMTFLADLNLAVLETHSLVRTTSTIADTGMIYMKVTEETGFTEMSDMKNFGKQVSLKKEKKNKLDNN